MLSAIFEANEFTGLAAIRGVATVRHSCAPEVEAIDAHQRH